jgi:hypothetical protein
MTYWEMKAGETSTDMLRHDLTYDLHLGFGQRKAWLRELEAREAMQRAKEEEHGREAREGDTSPTQ